MQANFRTIPSSIPIRSPSPDKKSVNIISPTYSPTAYQIRRNMTPMRNQHFFWSKRKQNDQQTRPKQLSTQVKAGYYNVNNLLQDKDQVIKQLKNVINMLTSNKSNQQDLQLKNQLKIITIQNQNLLQIIDRLKKNSGDSLNDCKMHVFKDQINDLQNTLSSTKSKYQKQRQQLIYSNKSLQKYCKTIEQYLKNSQRQNQTLMKLLKQQSEKKNIKPEEKGVNEKLTITKIKQQHYQNMKLLKQELKKKIQDIYEEMASVNQELRQKINNLQTRLQVFENYQSKKNKKSEIYIEENQSSSEQSKIKQQLSRIIEQSRTEYSKLQEQNLKLREINAKTQQQTKQLKQITTELDNDLKKANQSLIQFKDKYLQNYKAYQQMRFKYQKMCLDCSQVPFSKRNDNEIQSITIKNFNSSQKQKNSSQSYLYEIQQLKQFIRNLQQQKNEQIAEMQAKQYVIIEELAVSKNQQIQALQKKVKQLVSIYEKQLQILKHELHNKTVSITSLSQNNSSKQEQLFLQIQTMKQLQVKFEQEAKNQRQTLCDKIVSLQKQISSLQILRSQIQKLQLEVLNGSKSKHLLEVSNKNLQKKCQVLNDNLKRMKEDMETYSHQIQSLKKQIQQKEQKIKFFQNKIKDKDQIVTNFNQNMNKLKDKSLFNELEEIKNLLEGDKYFKIQNQLNQITTLYSNNLEKIEQKVIENQSLNKSIISYSQKLIQLQQNQIRLSEKINYLENTNQIYQRELQQRKQLCENLIVQKSNSQKQILQLSILIKERLGTDIQNNTKQKKLHDKIDNLIALQKDRLNYWENYIIQNNSQ